MAAKKTTRTRKGGSNTARSKRLDPDSFAFTLKGDKIRHLRVIDTKGSFRDGPTFADNIERWVSNFTNIGAASRKLRDPIIQAALKKIAGVVKQATTSE